jgi:tetratricopeptide (TPR) repeat protein
MEIADPEIKKKLGVGFESFLSQAAANATELDILNWVAESYRGMGESFGTDLKSLTPQAKGYFQKAAETYQRILDKGKAEPQFISPAMATQVRMQLAKSKKGMGDYKVAADFYEAILKESAMLLPVQIEAARLYQDWGGAAKGQEDNYLRAIVGARPDPNQQNRNTIWGWGVIAKLTAGNAQFREQFHDARYNLALCRYNYAIAQQDAKKKKEYLDMARRDIGFMVGLYPDMGGEVMRAKYDNLAKGVQKALGEKPVGLAPFQEPAVSAAPASAKTVPTSTASPGKK